MRPSPRGYTLVEMLVVMAILGTLTAVGVPALQRARETARGATCRQNLRDLALATVGYTQLFGNYPPGMDQSLFATAPIYRGNSLFVYLLPFLDQESLARQWNWTDPLTNTDGQEQSRAAVVLSKLLCPVDVLPSPRTSDGRWTYALTSYGGNGGTRSYFPSSATCNGIFHTTGSASEPQANQKPVRVNEVRDGLEGTILFGERSHRDPNYEAFSSSTGVASLETWGWWAAAGGRRSIGHVTLAAAAPLNYRHPAGNSPAVNADPSYYSDLRLTAFGSNHPGGANVAYAGANVAFLNDSISFLVLQNLCTRNGDRATAAATATGK
jgi:prepilin-type N-terminal cleavage/methylation domain-containing protein